MRNRFARILALTLALVLSLSAVAFADDVYVEGDTVGLAISTLSLGEVCLGSAASGTVSVIVKRTGNYGSTNVFKNGSSLTLGTSELSDGLTVSGSGDSIPGDWSGKEIGKASKAITAAISFTPTTVGANSGSVRFTVTGTSSKDGDSLTRSSGLLTVTATAKDCTPVSKADVTAPVITVPADMTVFATSAYGANVTYEATAEDETDGEVDVTCTPASGSQFPMGTTTVNCTASDSAGNEATASFTVTVNYKALSGFYAPVSMDSLNRIKAGATVALKFNVTLADDSYVTDSYVVKAFTVSALGTCEATEGTDLPGETTGGTTLRYDLTGQQFIQNWKSPSTPGCYKATMKLRDNQVITATFSAK